MPSQATLARKIMAICLNPLSVDFITGTHFRHMLRGHTLFGFVRYLERPAIACCSEHGG